MMSLKDIGQMWLNYWEKNNGNLADNRVRLCGDNNLTHIMGKNRREKKVITEPHNDHELRITKLEKTVDYEIKLRMEEYELRFKRDLERLDMKDRSDKLMMKSLLEIIRHEIDGNNTAKLKEVAEELNNFIFDN